ncbi:peptidoglycan DD-metalloendopeptidase family protein [Streptomyces sp. A7024]|uniref:Peptidoglycan DD-metalloendopeptidase family protein n=1 Tax=Streptomyces coryli TaxID=1128680 RepID=A0A6G4UAW9_9ACTN|nr:peptidoglycan DD-metalloendopeptidase family protein [Streptomyces coryli]
MDRRSPAHGHHPRSAARWRAGLGGGRGAGPGRRLGVGPAGWLGAGRAGWLGAGLAGRLRAAARWVAPRPPDCRTTRRWPAPGRSRLLRCGSRRLLIAVLAAALLTITSATAAPPRTGVGAEPSGATSGQAAQEEGIEADERRGPWIAPGDAQDGDRNGFLGARAGDRDGPAVTPPGDRDDPASARPGDRGDPASTQAGSQNGPAGTQPGSRNGPAVTQAGSRNDAAGTRPGDRIGSEDARPGDRIGPAGGRAWPVDGGAPQARPTLARGFEPPRSAYGPGHRGVDLLARPGQPVRAAAPGKVSFAGKVAGRGVVSIELTDSGTPPLRITYEPVRATVTKGDKVGAGGLIGVLQAGPFHCPEPCLHWGLRRNETYLNPLALLPKEMLRGGPSRLLPVFGVPLPHSGTKPRPHRARRTTARRTKPTLRSHRTKPGPALPTGGDLGSHAYRTEPGPRPLPAGV